MWFVRGPWGAQHGWKRRCCTLRCGCASSTLRPVSFFRLRSTEHVSFTSKAIILIPLLLQAEVYNPANPNWVVVLDLPYAAIYYFAFDGPFLYAIRFTAIFWGRNTPTP